MLEPVNTVLKAVKRLGLLRGDTVLVAGQGPIGLMFTRLLVLRGMKVVATDLFSARLRIAAELGAAEIFQVKIPKSNALPNRERSEASLLKHIVSVSGGRGLDAAVIAVPNADVVRQAQRLVRGGGRVMLFSHTRRHDEVPIDLAEVCVDEKDLIGSYSADFELQDEVARLVFSRRLDVRRLVTHEFPLEKTAEAVALAAKPTKDSLKVIVRAD